jgi:hypothetical protein
MHTVAATAVVIAVETALTSDCWTAAKMPGGGGSEKIFAVRNNGNLSEVTSSLSHNNAWGCAWVNPCTAIDHYGSLDDRLVDVEAR